MMAKRLGCIALCLVLSAIVYFLPVAQTAESRDSLAAPALKVVFPSGHGSGVHVGNGFIITAAHVVDGAQEISVTAIDGHSEPAEVLWSNAAYDVALLRMAGRGPSAPLYCENPPKIGDVVVAVGNPGPLEFIHSFGNVSSNIAPRGGKRSTYIASLAIAGGSSGGPVFDDQGRVVGIAVAVALANIGGMFPSQNGLAYVVPAHKGICTLLGNE